MDTKGAPHSTSNHAIGHRQRLRDRFLAGDGGAFTDGALLELLLAYAIPQQDVRSLAQRLLSKFDSLPGVLSADHAELCRVAGIKANSATLLKAIDWIRTRRADMADEPAGQLVVRNGQLPLFDTSPLDLSPATSEPAARPEPEPALATAATAAQSRVGLFVHTALGDAVQLLPRLPETDSLDEVRVFLRGALHYNAERTRSRFSEFIARRMFPSGYADRALRLFARRFTGRQELRDVCYYRLCVAEPLLFDITDDLLIPSIAAGKLERRHVQAYLATRFPASKSVSDATWGVVDALKAGGIAGADKTTLSFGYRSVLLPSFAFVLHSEFPEPGMYDIASLEHSRAIRAQLWSPDRILESLYELRNRGIISKVSEIDSVRQFTTRMTLEQAVEALMAEGSRA